MIKERESDIQIKYILVKKFSYLHPDIAEAFAGNPIQGKVYRSVYNINTKHHRLLLPDGVVMGFNVLIGESSDAVFELIEITKDNILDFNLSEEDLDVFLLPNTDIFFEPKQMIQNALSQRQDDEVDFANRASNTILNLWSINPDKAEILLTIAHCLTELELSSHEDAANSLRYSDKGLGINIAEALRALTRYSSDDRKTNEDTADLMVALEAIVVEMERNFNHE